MGKGHFEHQAPYGGQAVVEGVMMRSPRFFAVACRKANGEIVVKQEEVQSYLKRVMWLNKPFLRGTLALIDSMAMGIKALTFSANIAMEDEEAKTSADSAAISAVPIAGVDPAPDTVEVTAPLTDEKTKSGSINDIAVGATLFVGLAIGIGIFFVLPQLLAGLFEGWIKNHFLLNITEGLVRIVVFIGYILVISRMKDIKRVFQYHGAEHKVINTLEADQELVPDNFAKHTTIHPRCGTSFISIVLIVSILVFSLLGWDKTWYIRLGSRLVLLPIIAGISYELLRFAGKFRDTAFVKAMFAPGLAFQKLTTSEPSPDQVEVALRALEAVMTKEEETPAESVASR